MSQLPPGFVLDGAPAGMAPLPSPPKEPKEPTPSTPEDRERLRIAQDKEARDKREWDATHNPDGSPKPGVGKAPTEFQSKASAFLLRALGANDTYEAQEIGARSLVGQKVADVAPNALNSLPEVVGNSPRRQVADSSQDEFIAASLRQDSGAAIPPEEMERQRRIYFPMPGDGPDVIASKRQARARAIEGLKQAAGPEAEEVIARFTGMPKTGKARDADFFGLTGSVTDDSPGVNVRVTDDTPNGGGGGPDDGLTVRDVLRGAGQGLGSMVAGVGDFAGIVGNPLNATINAATGTNLSTDLGGSLRDTLGLPKNTTGTDAIIRAGTGAGAASLTARGLSALANPGVVKNVLGAFGRTPGADVAAGLGADAGTDIAQRSGAGIGGQIGAGVVGGLLGYKGAGMAARTGAPRVPNATMRAADDLGVTMLPADVGGVGTRMATGAVGRTLGGVPIAEGAQKAITSAGAARSRIAAGIGDAAADNVGGGQAVKRGFGQFEKDSRTRADQLYDAVSVPAESQVQLGNTRNALTEVTRGMQSNPALSRLWANHPRLRATLEALTPKDVAADGRKLYDEASARLARLLETKQQEIGSVPGPHRTANLNEQIAAAQADIAKARELLATPNQGGQLSWQDMQRFRSIVGEVIGQPGVARDGSDIAALRKLYAALTTDMEVTAAQAGPRALTEFRRANQFWRGREARIDDVFATLLGKDGNRSDEAVFKQINTWAKSQGGDFARIARTIRSMPADEANTIRATIVQRMGAAPAARQNATNEVFSPADFATQWHGMSDRAKAVLFPNKSHRKDLDAFAGLMDGMKRANEYQNFSNTSLGVNLTAQGTIAYANPVMAAVLAGLQFGAGKLLASPRFARFIASSAQLPPEMAMRKMPEQLAVIAAREPALAGDIQALQAHLQQAFGQSPLRAAADEKSDARREPPQ